MKLLHVAAAALETTPLDWDGNLARVLTLVARARAEGVQVLCLPELALTGYGCEDAFHAAFVHEAALDRLARVVEASRGLVLCVGLPFVHEHALFNVAALCVDGALVGLVPKQNLAGDGLHYEPRWFKAWPSGVRARVEVLGARVPIGDWVFEVGGVRFGFEICEDAWVAERPGVALSARGVDVILNPSASHFAFGKALVRERFVLEGSRAFGATYVYANLLGNEAGRVIYDGDTLVASGGELLARGPRLSLREVELASAVVDVSRTRSGKLRSASHRPALSAEGVVEVAGHAFAHAPPARGPSALAASRPAWERGGHLKEEEFARAVTRGLLDYLRKSRARGFVVSASGGADSSAVVCLVHLAARRVVEELAPEDRASLLAHLGLDAATLGDARALTGALLTTVYQACEGSSDRTRDAAAALSEAVGARHFAIELGDVAERYRALVGGALGRALAWRTDDLALQNIQARVRGPSAWLFANLTDSLLLATSNRSEAALGYATMDGDTCGGLSPIAGIDKRYLRAWLSWLEREGPAGIGAIPALAAITSQASTPELRPAEAAQTSEGDLMPFAVLDAIERQIVRDRRSPAEALEVLARADLGRSRAQLAQDIRRFVELFTRNQWKRERYAPSFHLDDENLDPRSWFRFPILSSGLRAELGTLSGVASTGEAP
jgi:NAD+ synthase (glutamine-hydrolysing)